MLYLSHILFPTWYIYWGKKIVFFFFIIKVCKTTATLLDRGARWRRRVKPANLEEKGVSGPPSKVPPQPTLVPPEADQWLHH